jgi:hypothetical protein
VSFFVIQIFIRIQNLKFLSLKMAKIQGSDGLMRKRKIAILNIYSILSRCQQVQNGFICWIWFRNGCVRAKRKKQSLMAPSPFNPPFWSFEKKNLLRYFFYRTFFSNPKFRLICIQFDLVMENLCLAAILLFSAILFFFAPIYFLNFF